MKRLVREPLLHFLLLGCVIFVAYSRVSKSTGDPPGKIVISQGDISSIVMGFTRAWQRPPTRDELKGLIRDRVREEVYCREAMAMGLDKDDTIIRRRLRQKLEFVSEDIVAGAEPTEAELEAYFRAHLESFRVPQRFTFNQVYLNPEKHPDAEVMKRDAAQLLTQFEKAGDKADLSAAGDAFLLEHEFAGISAEDIAKQFGETFAAQLARLAPGQWHGPIRSGYGMHLVLVRERTEEHLPVLAEVRESVRREWENARRLEGNEKFYRELLKRYSVTVESPTPAKEANKLAQGK